MPKVTHKTVEALLTDERGHEFIQHVVGRACVVLFNRQTTSEKASNDASVLNFEGFSGPDARQGSLTAKYYLRHKKLLDWQVDMWTKEWRGRPRLAKYWKQLNEAAESKAAGGTK
jgi:hypothetical protein